jgi:hypothetical protein
MPHPAPTCPATGDVRPPVEARGKAGSHPAVLTAAGANPASPADIPLMADFGQVTGATPRAELFPRRDPYEMAPT